MQDGVKRNIGFISQTIANTIWERHLKCIFVFICFTEVIFVHVDFLEVDPCKYTEKEM